jgi:hypothetical protein
MFRILLGVAVFLFGQGAMAQNLSVSDITALIDKTQGETNEYRTLLNDPDPERARLAMKIMLEQGDADLARMALEHGLYSTDAVVRRIALESFLRSRPFLAIRADTSGVDENTKVYVKRSMSKVGGSVDSEGIARMNHQLGEFDENLKCIRYHDSEHCAVRISDASVNLHYFGRWTDLTLGTDGVLRGMIFLDNVGTVPAEIPVSR